MGVEEAGNVGAVHVVAGGQRVSRRPAHSSRPQPRFTKIAAVIGGAASVIAIALGTMALVRSPDDTASALRSLDAITVSSGPAAVLPLSDREILELLDRNPDDGALADPARRAGCLAGLGYRASTAVLGARQITIDGHPGIVLLLAGSSAGSIVALAVSPTCSSANTGLLVETSLPRP